MATLKQRHHKFETRLRIPKALQPQYDGREFLYRTLAATDRRAAKLEADAWVLSLRAEWATRKSGGSASLRQVYDTFREITGLEQMRIEGDPHSFDEVTAGIEMELERMADHVGQAELSEEQQGKLWALQDARAEREGREVPRRSELEASFYALACDYLAQWERQQGLKETNTGQQKRATFDLFSSYIGDKPIWTVSRAKASEFVDALRRLDPNWARTGKARGQEDRLDWKGIQRQFGDHAKGLSVATVNRHVATLDAFWRWAEERGHCDGRNPFAGHRQALKEKRNKHGYIAWTNEELVSLFDPGPKRDDLREIMLVALYSGMRLNEIASLTYGQIREADGIAYFDVTHAKTEAGVRRVPIHSKLAWLVARRKGRTAEERLWPEFSPEGPGKKPSGDAGKLFSRHKLSLGFDSRTKVFHSFRKNFVGNLELARVPENEVAQLVGHEKKGITFGVYGTQAAMARLAEIVALVDYPEARLPRP
jgi:integrase